MTTEFERPRRVRLVDIAEHVGMSRRAVSAVLLGTGGTRVGVSAEKAEKIREVAAQMGYRPNFAARQLVGKRSHTYGLLVASAGDPLRSFLIQHLDSEAVGHGIRTLIGNTVVGDGQFEKSVELFANSGVDGVICAVHSWIPGDRQALLKAHPCTVFYEDPGIPGAVYVTVDREDAIQQAVAHLAERGRKRIGLALMGRSRFTQQQRIAGYQRGLSEHGLKEDPALIFSGEEEHGLVFAYHQADTLTWTFDESVITHLIDQVIIGQKADAIIAYDDYWAAALIKLLRRRGISVPGDVAVVGYLNHYLADFTDPPLTTIDQSHEAAAQKLVVALEEMITEQTVPGDLRRVMIKPRLIVRESS